MVPRVISDTATEPLMSDPNLLETRDNIALITLNRPERLNALNYALIDRLMAELDAIETDVTMRAVILTGAGDRAFSAGADIHEFAKTVRAGRDTAIRDFVRRKQGLFGGAARVPQGHRLPGVKLHALLGEQAGHPMGQGQVHVVAADQEVIAHGHPP